MNGNLNWIHCWVRDWAHWAGRNRLEIYKMLKVKGASVFGSGGSSNDFDTLVSRDDVRMFGIIDSAMTEIDPKLAKVLASNYLDRVDVPADLLAEALTAIEAEVVSRGVVKPVEGGKVRRIG